jgi:hypothetical protein
MLESGHRNALRFHGALMAAYVEAPGWTPRIASASIPIWPWRASWEPTFTA